VSISFFYFIWNCKIKWVYPVPVDHITFFFGFFKKNAVSKQKGYKKCKGVVVCKGLSKIKKDCRGLLICFVFVV